MILSHRSVMFILFGYFFLFIVVSEAASQCAIKKEGTGDYLHFSGKWNYDDTTYEYREGYCVIEFEDDCNIRLSHEKTEPKPWGCSVKGKAVRCWCTGRMCNLDVKSFHKMAITKLEKIKSCKYDDAPVLKWPMEDIVHCSLSMASDHLVTVDGKSWDETVITKTSSNVCGIWIFDDCRVKVYVTSTTGPNYLNKCHLYNEGNVWCECTEDYCNGDVEKWRKEADKIQGFNSTKCKLENPPKLTPTTATTPAPPIHPAAKEKENLQPVQFCGLSKLPYFDNGHYFPEHATYVASDFPCYAIFTNSCKVILGASNSMKEDRCSANKEKTIFECFCVSRLCNYDLDSFFEQMKELRVGASKDLFDRCHFERAPSLYGLPETQTCYSGKRLDSQRYHPGVYKKTGQEWRQPTETMIEITKKGCSIEFTRDCEVILSPAKDNYGPKWFNKCGSDPNHLNGRVVCQCFDQDNCNVDIKRWLKEAGAEGIGEWKCDWDEGKIPKYYVFPPTTASTRRRVSPLFIEYTPATAGEMGDPPAPSGEDETVATTTQSAGMCSLVVGAIFLLIFMLSFR